MRRAGLSPLGLVCRADGLLVPAATVTGARRALLSLSFSSSPFCCRGQRSGLVCAARGWASAKSAHPTVVCRFACGCALAHSLLLFVAVPLTRSEDDTLTALTMIRAAMCG